MVSTVSAGLFDFMGGDNANATANDENTFIVGFDAEQIMEEAKEMIRAAF